MNTVVGGEMMEHAGMTSGLEVTGEVFQSDASIVFDQAEKPPPHHQGDPRRNPRLESSPFGPRLHVMAGVAHPSGVMLPVTSSGVVLVYPLPTSPTPRPAVSRKRGDSGA
jgi:hypothetical protein